MVAKKLQQARCLMCGEAPVIRAAMSFGGSEIASRIDGYKGSCTNFSTHWLTYVCNVTTGL